MQKKKGISLIVLIITIVVMIILATVIILALNNSGIINKANQAVEVTDLAQIKHIATLKWSEAYLDKKTSQAELYNAVIDGLTAEGIDMSKYKITVTEAGVDVKVKIKYANETPVPEEWTENIVAVVDTVPIPKGFVASKATGECTKAGGLVIYEGTDAVTDANVKNARRTRNQYVWVPVDKATFATTFVRQNFGMGHTLSNRLGTNYWETVVNEATNLPLTTIAEQNETYMSEATLAEVQAMYASVKEYGGFYIARYEAGIDFQRTSAESELITGKNVHSKMGKIPYNNISWCTSNKVNIDTGGAVEVARGLYPANDKTNSTGVVSTLTYAVQWDTTLAWWIDTKAVTSVTYSTAYGNHSDHMINSPDDLNEGALVWDYTASTSGSYVTKDDASLTYPKNSGRMWALSTGALKASNVNNIYDMSGNMAELTMECLSNYARVNRAGSFNSPGALGKYPVADRGNYPPDRGHTIISFRPSLYIKK